jgi:hypothetical protein
MTGLLREPGYDRVTMIDADKGQGKIQDGYTCQKQLKTVNFLEFVVSISFSIFLQIKIMRNEQKTHTTRYKELGLTKQCNERTTH